MWHNTPNSILNVHGNEDWLVPYKNSKELEKQLDKNQFELVTIEEAGHGFVWSKFDQIKTQILKKLD